MQNKFEEEIKKQLDDFTLTPNNKVWDKIEDKLDANDHKKTPIWWVFVVAIIVSGTAFWYYNTLSLKFNYETSTITTKTNSSLLYSNKIPTTSNNTQSKDNLAVTKKANTAFVGINNPIEHSDKVSDYKPQYSSKSTTYKVNNYPTINPKYTISKVKQKVKLDKVFTNITLTANTQSLQSSGVVSKSPNSVDDEITVTIDSVNKIESTTLNTLKDSGLKTSKAIITVPTKLDSKHTKNKKSRLQFTLGGGITNISRLSQAYSSTLASTIDPNGPNISNNLSINSNPSIGFSFIAGITCQQPLSQKWQLVTGLNYLYTQNSQSVGLRHDSIKLSDDGHYFEAGHQTNRINYAQILQVPIQLKYPLNSHAKHPLYLLFGGSICYQLNSKWLVSDNKNVILYYKKAHTTNIVASALVGIGIVMNEISIDLTANQSINPIQSGNSSKLFLQQLSMDVNIPFNFISFNKQKK